MDHLIFRVRAGAELCSQILEIYDDSLVTYLPSSPSLGQDVSPRAVQRGVGIDGSLREAVPFGLAIAGNAMEGDSGGGCGSKEKICGDVRLSDGGYAPFAVDLALPAAGVQWMVGRTYNARQAIDTTHHDSDGYQWRNWFQSSQLEIVLYEDGSDAAKDMVYVLYGADRFIEFKRVNDRSSEFRGVNGAAGVVQEVASPASGEPSTFIYTDQRGVRVHFFGFDGDAGIAKGQLWKLVDPASPR